MNDNSYTEWASMSDLALAMRIGAFVKHYRIQQNKTQEELAHAAGISRSTLSLLERGDTINLATLIQVLRALDQLQVLEIFNIPAVISPLALAKKEKEKRKRVRSAPGPQKGKEQGTRSRSEW